MGKAPQYLPPTPDQIKRLEALIKAGWTIQRVIDNGVETLRVTKPPKRKK